MRRFCKGIVVWAVVVLMGINTSTACRWAHAKRAKHCQPVVCADVSKVACGAPQKCVPLQKCVPMQGMPVQKYVPVQKCPVQKCPIQKGGVHIGPGVEPTESDATTFQ